LDWTTRLEYWKSQKSNSALRFDPAHYLQHVNSFTSTCGVPLDVSTGSVSIGAAITLSWKVDKGIISTTIQSRSSSNTNVGRGGRTSLTYRRGENSRGKSVSHEGD